MALDPMTASSAIAQAYLTYAGLDSNGEISGAEPMQNDYPAEFASAYNDYAKAGIVLGAENQGGDASILESFMNGLSESSPSNVTAFAQALADFWATVAIQPGPAEHGGMSVSNVINNASSLTGAFEAAINASLTTSESKPYFYDLINNIEAIAVSQIIWTVTELMPPTGTPSDFPEPIS